MFKSFFPQKKEEIVAIFDIGSGVLQGAFVKLVHGSKAEILWAESVELAFKKSGDPEKIASSMLGHLEELLKIMTTKGAHTLSLRGISAPREGFLMFAAPWTFTHTKIINVVHEKEFTADKGFLEHLLKEEENELIKSMPELSKVIERKVLSLRINGYETSMHFKGRCKELSLGVVFGSMDEYIYTAAKSLVSTYFPKTTIHVHSFSLASVIALRDIFPGEKDFLLIDVGSEITELAVVKNNLFQESASFPSGKNFLVRKVMANINTDHALALSELHLYAEGTLEPIIAKKMSSIIKDGEKEWLRHFGKALQESNDLLHLPRIVFVTASKDILSIFGNFVRNDEFGQFVLTDGKFKVVEIELGTLLNHLNVSKDVKISLGEPFIALESIFANRIFSA